MMKQSNLPALGVGRQQVVSGQFFASSGTEGKILADHLQSVIDETGRSNSTLRMLPSFSELLKNGEKELEEKLFDALAACKQKTAAVAMHLDREWRRRFFSQLDRLMDIDEWDDDDQPVTLASFTTLLRLLLLLRPDRRPGLGITNNGHIIAAWTSGKDQLTIECLPNDQLSWVVVRFDEGERESAAGRSFLNRIKSVLSPYEPEAWLSA